MDRYGISITLDDSIGDACSRFTCYDLGTVDAQRQAKALTREKTREMLQRQDYHPDILINLLFGVADLAG
jgi:hypothetical protein